MNKKEQKQMQIVGVGRLWATRTSKKMPKTTPTPHSNLNSKLQTLTSDHRGITLIALIITIIVMLILVGVTVSIAINGGLFANAKQAKTDTQNAINAENELSEGKVNIDGKIYNSIDEYLGNSGDKGGTGDYKPVSELFDENGKDENAEGYDPNKLHIGDFINYNAGTWTQEEIDAIIVGQNGYEVSATGNRELPTRAYQFGGFVAGDSRNGNAKPSVDTYNYIKDDTDTAITGWRVFDVNDNKITLISAGCPEDFRVNGSSGYESEYILSGNVNIFTPSGLDLTNKYTKRDWGKYVNDAQHGVSANAITKKDLDNWYNKYMDISSADTDTDSTFQKIYKTRYENLIDNYSYYWLASAYGSLAVFHVYPYSREVSNDGANGGKAYGVRILITLESNIQLSKNGEKTVANIANDSKRNTQPITYNVWDIQ